MMHNNLRESGALEVIDNDDIISEVYKGGVWSKRLTRIAVARIDWICSQVSGETVLDIGCSQGIASILLARKGFVVTGIDLSPKAIDYALADAAKESLEVQERLRFQLCRLEDFPVEAHFDAVLLGEVLEHQSKPALFIDEAARRLRPGGKVIITTPFGFEPYPDHKSQLFPGWFARLEAPEIELVSLEVKANYIMAVVRKLEAGETKKTLSWRSLLRLTEGATLNSQKKLYNIISAKNDEISALKDVISNLKDEISTVKEVTSVMEAKHAEEMVALEGAIIASERTRTELSQAGLDLLKQYEAFHAKAQKLSGEADQIRQGVQYRIGREIVSSRKNLLRLLALPLSIFRIVRQSSKQGTKSSKVPPRQVPIASGQSVNLFLRKEAKWVKIPVVPGDRYVLRGSVNSFRGNNSKGAILLIRFEDGNGSVIPFQDANFAAQAKKGQSYCYLETGAGIEFDVSVQAPPNAVSLSIGASRFAEQIPINFALKPISTVSQNKLNFQEGGEPRLSMASIFDEFTHECFAPDVNLVPVTRSNWKHEIKAAPIAAFFAESTWRGNGGEWKYAMTKPEKWGREIDEILHHCRDTEIPSLFWNKEDPVNFDVFQEVAKKFDFIFTTDNGCVDKYREITGRENAFTLAFAAQPALHNPIRATEVIDRVAFTGSWRGIKYPRRAEWLDLLLTPLMKKGVLDIFDRYADETKNPDLIFPDKFKPALRGALEYPQLVKQVYKRYNAFVNVNSVEGSETMLARRVFELLGCGAPVISSHSEAIEKTFGDLVLMPQTSQEVEAIVDRLFDGSLYRERLATRGVRLVHSQHTYRDRLEQIGEAIGTPFIAKRRKKASVIVCSKRPDFLFHAATQVSQQTYADHEVLFVKHSPNYKDDEIAQAFSGEASLKILEINSDQVLADGLNLAMRHADGDVFAKFDDDDYYGPNYLEDAILAFGYAPRAGLVGKQTFFAYVESVNQTVHRFPGKSYQFTKRVHGGTFVWDRRKTEDAQFTRTRQGTDTLFLKTLVSQNVPIFSADPFNFIHVRYADLSKHTWKIEDQEFLTKAVTLGEGLRLGDTFV
jgi:2-polyprenyl-3-methyl-5-hydroxy-6-metoxy-1,4-benzoquinol methylase/spore maturation protein CgeB